MRLVIKSMLVLSAWALLTLPHVAEAGVWNQGKWGQMYWGFNAETAPVVAPVVDAQADGTDIRFALLNLLSGAENGWSSIVSFEVTCDGLATVTISAKQPVLANLQPETQYNCTIVAINELNGAYGRSPPGNFSVTTEEVYEHRPLPIWMLYQAIQQAS